MNKILKITSYIVLITFLFSQIAYADTIYFYHTDPAGTPIAMTDASGSVVWKADYKPFGEEWSVTANIENNKKFVGKEKDTETGLSYFGARYMSSNIGRFISTDPVGPVNPATGDINQTILNNPQRLNLYSYGLNNPYRYVDTDGNIPLDTIWDVGNVIYDIATGDWESLAIDVVCMMIPYVPAGVSKVGKVVKVADKVGDAVKVADKAGDTAKVAKVSVELVDGMKIPTGKALETASEFLGDGYKQVGKGRYVSADGLRQVRMKDADILGKHGGGPHMNFETFDKPIGKGAKPIENKHIYFED